MSAERLEIPQGLGAPEGPEGIRRSGDGHILAVVGREEQEQPCRGSPLMVLPGRVQVPGPVSERGGQPRAVAEAYPDRLQSLVGRRLLGQVRHQGDVVPGPALGEPPPQGPGDRPLRSVAVQAQGAFDEGGRLLGQPAVFADAVEEPVGIVLALLHVRLVERVDAQDGAGGRRRELPPKEFPAQIEEVVHLDRHHRMPGLSETLDPSVERAVVLPDADMREQPVLAVDRRIPERLVGHRQEAGAGLAGAFGHELLEPHPERGDGRGHQQGDLVPSPPGQFAHRGAERHTGVLLGGHVRRAGAHHAECAVEQAGHIHALERRRHQAEVGERRVPAADVGEVEEHPAVAAPPALLDQRGPGIGDRDEVLTGPLPLEGAEPRVEVLAERRRLRRRSRFAGDDEQRLRERHRALHPGDRRRIRGVEHGDRQSLRERRERPPKHEGREAAPAHPHVHRVTDAGGPRLRGEPHEVAEGLLHLLGDVEPAEGSADAGLDVRIGAPQGGIPAPQP